MMYKRIFLFAFAMMFVGLGFAEPVSVQNAQKAATQFLYSKTGDRYIDMELFDYPYTEQGGNSFPFYIFVNKGGVGFVVIAGDNVAQPVLGYSFENGFANEQGISPEVSYWLSLYADQIKEMQTLGIEATPEVTDEWQFLLSDASNSGSVAQKVTGVSPMLTTKWNQLPYYNQLCPTTPATQSNPTKNAPAGCVAVAMAQIMKYWNYPTKGTGSQSYNTSTVGGTLSANFGSTTYDWNNMPNALSQYTTITQKTAVTTLVYHCGVAVHMDYNVNSSGALVINYGYSNLACSENVLPMFFGYSKNIKGYQRGQFSSSDWLKMLKYELDNGRPILYTGQGQAGGHAFVFDGYNDNNYFHVNWGWGGMSDGYFVVSNLSPSSLGAGGGSGGFNSNQEALIMIQPSSSSLPKNPYTPGSSSSASYKLYNVDGPESDYDKVYVSEKYSVTCKIKNNGPGDFDNSVYDLALIAMDTVSGKLYLVDQRARTLKAGASYDYAYSTNKFDKLNPGIYYMVYSLLNKSENTVTFIGTSSGSVTAAILRVLPDRTGIESLVAANEVFVYPNPVDKLLHIQQKDLQRVQLFDQHGRLVYESTTESAQMTIPTGQLSSGQYYLKLYSSKGLETRKVSVQH